MTDDATPPLSLQTLAYLVDALQRGLLTLDVLRERGDVFIEHLRDGKPALLNFGHELVMDGRDLPEACNYALLRILPPEGAQLNDALRPIVVVDPRAGHGPGIGGFKPESEVGVALAHGHPVYFVTFRPEPEDGQTLVSVARAEAAFIDAVRQRHPQAAEPAVVANCQAGWAIATLAAVDHRIRGPLVLNGAPLSYWAGSPTQNPMRYSGGLLGGAWLAALTADLSGDRFDGAWLVQNFESLNLGQTLWGKLYHLYANVDTERERFLAFERWWGGYFRMTGAEIEAIVENLFVGNRLARGELVVEGQPVSLRDIEAPLLIFSSWGDNITPPQQALDWLIDVWGTEDAIAAAGRTIVYLLHPSVGHLGIFVAAGVARREHTQIVNALDQVSAMPPGLYEMIIVDNDGDVAVDFEPRTMADIAALNADERRDEALFDTVAQLSEAQMAAYRQWLQPLVRTLGGRAVGEWLRWLHPLRLQHLTVSSLQPYAAALQVAATGAREHRQPLAADNPWTTWERLASDHVVRSLNAVGHWRDMAVEHWVTQAYGPLGLGAWLKPQRERA